MVDVLIAGIVAMVISIVAGPRFINFLRLREYGQPIREEGPARHVEKQGTPTMGGLLIIFSAAVPYLILSNYTTPALTVCFCAVGCGQKVYVKDGQVTQIEGDPASPISRGRLCPKGSASKQLVTSPSRVTTVRYRRPGGTRWEDLDLDTAIDMIADRVLAARDVGWEETDSEGRRLRRTMGFTSLGGATLDNEENYLMKKLYTAMGAIQIENQARI